jgi:hypothetical protein
MRASNSPNLRSPSIFAVVRRSIARAHEARFHIVHFSVQQDHLHLIVEAGDRIALRNCVRGLAIRIARAVNRVAKRRGARFIDRFHARPLSTPREVRASVVYVLQNFRKHLRAPRGLDPCSSGPVRWMNQAARAAPWRMPGRARSELACPIGWRRCGLVDDSESPGAHKDHGPTART